MHEARVTQPETREMDREESAAAEQRRRAKDHADRGEREHRVQPLVLEAQTVRGRDERATACPPHRGADSDLQEEPHRELGGARRRIRDQRQQTNGQEHRRGIVDPGFQLEQ